MIRLRPWSALILAVLLTPALRAEDKPAAPWAVDRTLLVSPQGAPVPVLKYRLLPLSSELREGNAAPIYLRLAHERSDAERKSWTETPAPWNLLSVDKVPVAEARKFLEDHRYLLHQLELGARRRTIEWDYTLDAGNPIGLLLPDLQWLRNYAPMLILQARVALARGDFPAAAHHLQTGFAFSRHVADGPTLIHKMIGFGLVGQFAGTVADFIERPDAPNLYWALTALPRPLIDPRDSTEWEYRMVEMQIPVLADLERERTPEQWDGVLRRVRTELRLIAGLTSEGGKQKLPDWLPKDCAPEDAATKSPDLAAARQFVARARGIPAEQAEALPAAQVLLLAMVGTFHEDRDNFFRAAYLPYPQALPLLEAEHKRLLAAPVSEGRVLSRIFIPALDRVNATEARVERNLAALRVVEALRMYAAAHDGRLPDQLNDVTEVPLPNDPRTGRQFEYHVAGDTGTLISQVPGEPLPLRYRVSIRKK
jgi:hypothetical protein